MQQEWQKWKRVDVLTSFSAKITSSHCLAFRHVKMLSIVECVCSIEYYKEMGRYGPIYQYIRWIWAERKFSSDIILMLAPTIITTVMQRPLLRHFRLSIAPRYLIPWVNPLTQRMTVIGSGPAPAGNCMWQRSATCFTNTRVSPLTLIFMSNDNNVDIRYRNAIKYMHQAVRITGLDQPILRKWSKPLQAFKTCLHTMSTRITSTNGHHLHTHHIKKLKSIIDISPTEMMIHMDHLFRWDGMLIQLAN